MAAIPLVNPSEPSLGMGGDPRLVGSTAGENCPGDAGELVGECDRQHVAVEALGCLLDPRPQTAHRRTRPPRLMALLVNPTSANLAKAHSKEQQAAARTLGLQLHVLHASTEDDFDAVFASLVQVRAGGLVIGTDSLFNTWKEQPAALSVRHGVPTIHQYREFVVAGGLIGYGTQTAELSRQVGVYTGRILKGEKPANMPIQQATKVELFINLKTARALGLTVPTSLLVRADEVVE
jgi:putative ABC transport system substrate-binding protein